MFNEKLFKILMMDSMNQIRNNLKAYVNKSKNIQIYFIYECSVPILSLYLFLRVLCVSSTFRHFLIFIIIHHLVQFNNK